MNILVIGCDQVGASLIRDLERIGHDISLIERDPEQLKRLDAFDDYRFGGTALVGDPTDPDVPAPGRRGELRRRGRRERGRLGEPDGRADRQRASSGAEKVICRVSDPHLQVLYHKAYELETVCPTVLTEQAVFRALAK